MVLLKFVFLSNGKLYPFFPCKWYTLKNFPGKWPTLLMFNSQMVLFKIVSPSNGVLYPCFPCKWYALKSFSPQMAHFIHVSLANGPL